MSLRLCLGCWFGILVSGCSCSPPGFEFCDYCGCYTRCRFGFRYYKWCCGMVSFDLLAY